MLGPEQVGQGLLGATINSFPVGIKSNGKIFRAYLSTQLNSKEEHEMELPRCDHSWDNCPLSLTPGSAITWHLLLWLDLRDDQDEKDKAEKEAFKLLSS